MKKEKQLFSCYVAPRIGCKKQEEIFLKFFQPKVFVERAVIFP